MTKHVLAGLRPEPLASYLAGLGVIRVLGEQTDPELIAWWDTAGLVVETAVDDIAGWLADDFIPTPVIRAWNDGSGFGVGDGAPSPELQQLLAIASPRLDPYRATLRAAQEAAAKFRGTRAWSSEQVVREFRNRCPEEALAWIDAAAVLADRKLHYPPLLGTGGNDGRFDFSGNLHEHLLTIFDQRASADGRVVALARDLLAGTQTQTLTSAAVGQFDPAAAGGRNSSPFGMADSLVNPWGFVLMLEGAVMFAAAATRRHQHDADRAAIPFTVRESPEGSASGAAETSRGELWAPQWDQAFTYAEVKQLFGEARAAWRGRPAQRAVEFYAATRTLGVSRGVAAFTRFGIHQRNGQAHVAVPIERVTVTSRPEVILAARVEEWVTNARRGEASTAVGQAVRRYDKAHMAFARDGGPQALGRLLASVTDLELAVSRSRRARETVHPRRPPPAGAFLQWLRPAESPELRVAVGLASCRTHKGSFPSRTMRQILVPVDPGPPHPAWRDTPIVAGLGLQPLRQVLAKVLAWRARTVLDEQSSAGQAHRIRGVTTFPHGIAVPDADLHAFARNSLDEDLLEMWLKASLALDWSQVRHDWPDPSPPRWPVPLLGMLHALAGGMIAEGAGDATARLALEPDWPVRVAGGQLRSVHIDAARRLRQIGLRVAGPPERTSDRVALGVGIAAALVARCAKPQRVLHRYLATPLTPKEEPDSYEPDSVSEEELS